MYLPDPSRSGRKAKQKITALSFLNILFYFSFFIFNFFFYSLQLKLRTWFLSIFLLSVVSFPTICSCGQNWKNHEENCWFFLNFFCLNSTVWDQLQAHRSREFVTHQNLLPLKRNKRKRNETGSCVYISYLRARTTVSIWIRKWFNIVAVVVVVVTVIIKPPAFFLFTE